MNFKSFFNGAKQAKRLSILMLIFLLFSSQSKAQSCLVNTLKIHTGYDPVTNTMLAAGSSDPNWRVTAGTAAFYTASGASNGAAIATNPGWPGPTTGWISYAATGSAGYPAPPGPIYEMELSRNFTLCNDDDITFNLTVKRDNYIRDILVDNFSYGIFSELPNMNTTNFQTFTACNVVTIPLLAGTHTITVIVGNFGAGTPSNPVNNPHGLNVFGTITSTTNSIVGPNCPQNYVCAAPCSDECYWKVTGNNILNGNNIFGTLTNDNVRIQTNAADRGTFDNNGLLGWNTMSPTAYLHVDCIGHNPNNGTISDVRFENLEIGKGSILVIDQAGYVYDSHIDIQQVFQLQKTNDELAERNRTLEEEIKLLDAKVDAVLKAKGVDVNTATENILFQNSPNPFNKETTIRFEVKNMNSSASIKIYDLNGKELRSYPINKQGTGEVKVAQENLAAGLYLYSLVVDGKECATKRMVLTK